MRACCPPTLCAALLALGSVLCSPPPLPDLRPDVFVPLIDTVRVDRVGAWGWPRDRTAPLDRRIAQGTRFSSTWAPSSWTRPSMGAVLTGRLRFLHRQPVVFWWMDPGGSTPNADDVPLPSGPDIHAQALRCARAAREQPLRLFVGVMEVHGDRPAYLPCRVGIVSPWC